MCKDAAPRAQEFEMPQNENDISVTVVFHSPENPRGSRIERNSEKVAPRARHISANRRSKRVKGEVSSVS